MVEDVELLDKQFDPTTTLYFQQKVNNFFSCLKTFFISPLFQKLFLLCRKKASVLTKFKQFHANLIFGNKARTLLDLVETLRQGRLLPYCHRK
jgi:hypothetical protein